MMTNFFLILYNTIESSQFLLAVIVASLIVKLYLLRRIFSHGIKSKHIPKPWIFLTATLGGALFGDVAWIIKIARSLLMPSIPYSTILFFIRIAWGFVVIQFQSLTLFIQSLPEKNFKLDIFQKTLIGISSIFSLSFFYFAFFDSTIVLEHERNLQLNFTNAPDLEVYLMSYTSLYLFLSLIASGIYFLIRHRNTSTLPKILKKQLRVFIVYLIGPYFLTEFLQVGHFFFESIQEYSQPIISAATILLAYASYYCITKVMGLRFLNSTNHIDSKPKMYFIKQFKTTLEQLGHAENMQEISYIAQTFFNETLHIPLHTTSLHLRNKNLINNQINLDKYERMELIVEQFMQAHSQSICRFIDEQEILIYDNITFSNFYEDDNDSIAITHFLESLDADVFIPIFHQKKMIAYVIVRRDPHRTECFTKFERDEMLILANYLGNSINLIQNRNIRSLIRQEQKLKEQVYYKHQEVNQYKESIRSFLRSTKQEMAGIIFYKNRTFVFGNQVAKELIGIDLNQNVGHPLTRAIKEIAEQVNTYQSPQTTLVKNQEGKQLSISGVPQLERNAIILTVYYPDISDIVSQHMNQLQNPTEWDYILYLETTKAGHLINQLIPASTDRLLNIKINLLKTSLHKGATLLDVSDDDLQTITDLLHHLSMRETLHNLNIRPNTNNTDIAEQLFGINPNLKFSAATQRLLEKLSDTGTISIKNVHNLEQHMQDHLAEFIAYGCFRVYKTEQKIPSNIRLICSINQPLQQLAQSGSLSKNLYHELKDKYFGIPSLASLPKQEIVALADGFTQQIIQTEAFRSLLTLTEKEKEFIVQKCPESLSGFKEMVQQIIIKKSKKNNIYQETEFEPTLTTHDPELIAAARLGKHALKDRKIMSMLWQAFHSQNKIASFLGVNRSSVNRRCKEFELQ
jgi:transcriptional regulator with PAS, ATPase and Fis domain